MPKTSLTDTTDDEGTDKGTRGPVSVWPDNSGHWLPDANRVAEETHRGHLRPEGTGQWFLDAVLVSASG